MKPFDPTEIKQVQQTATTVFSRQQISGAVSDIANKVNQHFSDEPVLAICVLNGGLIFAGQLLSQLTMPLQQDYIHASRYNNQTEGAQLQWKALPQNSLKNQNILLIDDLIDQGHTLEAINNHCLEQGANSVCTAVLLEKDGCRETTFQADFIGLTAPPLYLFGCGMDYKGYLRNCSEILAVDPKLLT